MSGDPAASLHDVRTESDLLGLLLIGSLGQAHDAASLLEPDDFNSPIHRVAFERVVELVLEDRPVTAIDLQGAILAVDMDRSAPLDWMSNDFSAALPQLTQRILAFSRRRKIYRQARSLMQGVLDEREDETELVLGAIRELERVPTVIGGDALGSELDGVIASRNADEDPWLIDGLLYPQDRLMLVAGEGAGKSLMGRQVSLCAQAGLHPFTRSKLQNGPVRCLTFDLENRPQAVSYTMNLALLAIRNLVPDFVPTGHTAEIPDGINLLDRYDRRRFEATIKLHRPQLVFVGPLYKAFMTSGSKTDSEEVAQDVARFLDRMSRKYEFALWMEHHAPLGAGTERQLRPYGTSFWLRWPEYGKNFWIDEKEPHRVNVGKFRNDRSLVYWPGTLIRGTDGFPFTGDYGNRVDLQVNGVPSKMIIPAQG